MLMRARSEISIKLGCCCCFKLNLTGEGGVKFPQWVPGLRVEHMVIEVPANIHST